MTEVCLAVNVLRRFVLVASLAIAALARAGEAQPEWNAVIVRFDIDADGKLHITEQVTVDVPPSVQRLERTYWEDAEQKVTVGAITLYTEDRTVRLEESSDLDRAHRFRQSEWPGRVVWSVRDKADVPASTRTLTWVIESRVSDAVIPAWSIPRGKVLSHDDSRLGDPRERLRAVIPIWREALKNPRHRFLVDYQYDMPPPSTNGTSIQLQIYWPARWKPVGEITPDTVATPIKRDSYNPDRYRLLHLFEEDSGRVLTGIDVPRHAIRMASLAGFPIVGLLFWLIFVLIELVRRPAPYVTAVPWSSRLTSFTLFAAGIYFAVQETVRLHREPAVLGATLVAAATLFTVWPDRIIREAVRSSLRNALFLLIPLAIFTAIIVIVHFAAQMPPGFFASAGMSLAFLGTYKAMLARARSGLRSKRSAQTRDGDRPFSP